MLSFAFLLIVVDDAQEWGRKRISELYVNKDSTYEFVSLVPSFDIKESEHGNEKIKIHSFKVKEKFYLKNEDDLQGTLLSLYKQCKGYKEIFRDGQDTIRRNFIFEKQCDIEFAGTKPIDFCVELIISNEDRPQFTIMTSCDSKNPLEKFGIDFFKKVYNKYDVKVIENSSERKSYKYEITDKAE